MKKIALMWGILASTFFLASCASQGTTDQATAMSSDTGTTQTTTTSVAHHDYKGEAIK
jgi:uncharacterized lipoprotein YajG